MSERKDEGEAVVREAEKAKEAEETEDAGPQSTAEEVESQSDHGEAGQSSESERESEGEEDWEDEEYMDGSMESEPEPDPLIFQLVRQGNLAGVRKILKSDRTAIYQQDSMGHTPIHVTRGKDSRALDMAKLLLSYGAQVNSQASEFWTPLHIASLQGKKELCNLLLTNGAKYDLTLEYDKKTPVDSARSSLALLENTREIFQMFKR